MLSNPARLVSNLVASPTNTLHLESTRQLWKIMQQTFETVYFKYSRLNPAKANTWNQKNLMTMTNPHKRESSGRTDGGHSEKERLVKNTQNSTPKRTRIPSLKSAIESKQRSVRNSRPRRNSCVFESGRGRGQTERTQICLVSIRPNTRSQKNLTTTTNHQGELW